MSDCERFRDLMVSKLYGDMRPEDQEALSLHMAMCEECERAWAEYSSIRDAASMIEDPEPGDQTMSFLMGAAEEQAVSRRRDMAKRSRRRVGVLSLAVAAGALLVFGITMELGNVFGDLEETKVPVEPRMTERQPLLDTVEERPTEHGGWKKRVSPVGVVGGIAGEEKKIVSDKALDRTTSMGGKLGSKTKVAASRAGETARVRSKRKRAVSRSKKSRNKVAVNKPGRSMGKGPVPNRFVPENVSVKSVKRKGSGKNVEATPAETPPARAAFGQIADESPETKSVPMAGIQEDSGSVSERRGISRFRHRRRSAGPGKRRTVDADEAASDASKFLKRARQAKSSGRLNAALKLYLLALPDLEGKDQEDAYFEAAQCAKALGKNDQARKLMEEMVKKHPSSRKRAKELQLK